MTVSTSVHSNAFNFMSFVKGGVDPRTGQYTLAIELPALQANDLRGPSLPLSLGYNPLNGTDSGFGLGWSLRLSQYMPGNQVVSLASGESFKVTESGDAGRLLMREQKIDSFHFYQVAQDRYRIAHKSGLTEWLEVRGSASHLVAVPVQVQAPEGHVLNLDYTTFNGTYPLLNSVTDQAGQVLLSVERTSSEVRILMNPGAGEAGEPLASFIMSLVGSDHHVIRITLPTEEQASWRFGYQRVNEHLCLSSVETPTGAQEQLFYQDGGHQLPANAGRTPLPRVTRHRVEPGFDQASVDVHYSYGPGVHNFLGGGLNIGWAEDGLDNLYRHGGTYEYQCTETLHVDEQPVRSIQRTFNRFHLVTEEITTQGKARKSVKTLYHDHDGVPFEQQPRQCQLPSETTTSWGLTDDATRFRSEKVTTAYDDHGNLTREVQATGVTEASTWYSAAGEGDDCPPDPEGFVRWLKDKTVTPAPAEGDAPLLRTRYRYLGLPALDGSGQPDWLATHSETLVQVLGEQEQTLQQTSFEYLDTPGDAFLHGRTQRQTLSINGHDTVTDSLYSRESSPLFGQSILRTVQTLSGFDGEQKVITLEHSLFTGEPLLNRDDNDVEIRYHYDALRRVVEETVAPGTPWEASRTYNYQLCANPGEQAWQSQVDVKDVQTVSFFDGLNRVVRETRADADTLGRQDQQRPIYAARYDAWGQLREETELDWLESRQLALSSQYDYDDWGEQRCVTGPDGVRSIEETDPIGTPASAGPIRRSWREEAGGSGLRTGVTETWLSLFEQPTRVERFDRSGQSLSLLSYDYDGLGRKIAERQTVDQGERVTAYRYDAFDRETETTLADDAMVHRGYAAHSAEDLPVRISVEHNGADKLLGEQVFDGLDRRREAITGGRRQVFTYEPGLFQPKDMTTASGELVEYEYQPQLGTEPVRRRLPGSVQAEYGYDVKNALLLDCQEQGEFLAREYFSTQQLKRETRRSGDGTEYQMHYRYSRLGRLLGYTDVLGQEQTCAYDDQGRLTDTDLGSTHAHLEYDALGRVQSVVTRDDQSGQQLGTELAYDDFDRETLRTFDLNGTLQTLEQHWNEDDELTRRTLKEGTELLRDETYAYDARGRLSNYECSGSQPPVDPYGKRVQRQVYIYDALDNITTVMTYSDAGTNRARYFHDGPDPAQLTRIENNHADYPTVIHLDYDDNGNLLRDEAGRTLTYDALNRLLTVSGPGAGGSYHYDPLDRVGGQDDEQRFYQGDQLATRQGAQGSSRYLRGGDLLLAEVGQTLLGTDQHNSVLHELRATGDESRAYLPHGQEGDSPKPDGGPAFNGQYAEPAIGWQLLGNGYRAYNPALLRFHAPDSLSPFDEGGLNAYAYCEGDPVNVEDPSGHGFFSWFRGGRVTTASPVAETVPSRLKVHKPGRSISNLEKLKVVDVRNLELINKSTQGEFLAMQRFKQNPHYLPPKYKSDPTLLREMKRQHGDIQKVAEFDYQQISDQHLPIAAAYDYAFKHVGKPGITKEARRILEHEANEIRAKMTADFRRRFGQSAGSGVDRLFGRRNQHGRFD
ncbi:RHS repeat-associated core domain-containing protein [Pseudomonas sp. DTU_2021_1001937_2_SI_NGA_ILE_001]|uniref:RHS repeat domain-containing protein n=1 Tax=Pseudomonas sp. DTU_2021_1001937_2_SI_NGA_ILE_001 TaxID=3077589 RepID=UPI0028FC2AC6|nr:RHS repeat-associated core domain-containing protein [Pseudomonas sp. DTU_2021_1001937_2_SI_NGA_ILE_001]WNW10755.1 RHS repeat-associated core domain-containing protein [Pseudomonas sp. DTU_2021_1001937_2_SI_NGA_ILE_001]